MKAVVTHRWGGFLGLSWQGCSVSLVYTPREREALARAIKKHGNIQAAIKAQRRNRP